MALRDLGSSGGPARSTNAATHFISVQITKSACTTFIWLNKVHALILCLFKYSSFLKVNQHAQHSYGSTTRFMLIYFVNLQIFFDFES